MLSKFVLATAAQISKISKKFLAGDHLTISSVLIVLALLINGLWASNWGDGPSHRLRLYLVAKRDLPVNARLEAEHVKLRLGLLHAADTPFVPDVSLVVGKYTQRAFTAGQRISRNDIASTPFLNPPTGGAVIPVIVKAEHAHILKPTMRLRFIRSDSVIPMQDALSGKADLPGFGLRAIMPPPDKSPTTMVLLVELRPNQMKYASLLTTSSWVPAAIDP